MAKEVERNFMVLREFISHENVQVMAELITIKQTKCLIGYIGNNAVMAHRRVYLDVIRKDEDGYVLSDFYDLVQDVAIFLCEHFGKYLDDYLYTSKKGKAVTVKMECYYIIKRELYRRLRQRQNTFIGRLQIFQRQERLYRNIRRRSRSEL